MDLKAVQQYVCVSERTLREWLHLPVNPLPATQVARGKILINRSQLDRWLETHRFQPVDSIDIDRITDDIMNNLHEAAAQWA
jgi:excisionase family DNA binding protein